MRDDSRQPVREPKTGRGSRAGAAIRAVVMVMLALPGASALAESRYNKTVDMNTVSLSFCVPKEFLAWEPECDFECSDTPDGKGSWYCLRTAEHVRQWCDPDWDGRPMTLRNCSR